MKILAIDTVCKSSSICILDDEKILCDIELNIGKTQSKILLPMLDSALRLSNLSINDIDIIICANGPGSFTGLRIMLSTIKAIAHTLNLPIFGVDTLCGISSCHSEKENLLICPIIDARNRNVYNAIYYKNKEIVVSNNMSIEEYLKVVEKIKKELNVEIAYFVGDGIENYREDILLYSPTNIVAEYRNSLNNAYGLYKAYKNGNAKEYTFDNLSVNYLKKAQAQIDLESGKLIL